MYTKQQIAKIKELGNEWHKGEHHRVYFNNLGQLYGIETSRYNSGNIQSARLDGQKISNSQARRILQRLNFVKIWFCLVAQEFQCKDYYGDLHNGDFERIVAAIEAQL